MPRRRMLIASALALALAGAQSVYGQFDEYGVKAAFVRNFLAFVDWPATRFQAGDNLLMCVYNDSPVTSRLNAMTFDAARGHRVQVRTINTVPDLSVCHAVFVPAAEWMVIGDISSRYKGSGLLTISEEAVERSGAVLNMYESQGRMTFDVDLAAADTLGVHVSSKLSALARRVHGNAAKASGHASDN